LDDTFLDKISSEKEGMAIKKGTILFKAGDPADTFYCIKSGLVRTYRLSGQGKEQTFRIKTTGDWVGCRDVILSDIYYYAAVCMNDVQACAFPKSVINELNNDPVFQHELLVQMAKFWRDSENQIYSLGTKQIHSKLAEFLITFYKSNNCEEEVTLSVTREIIASIIGTTTESVIRSLSDFKAREWIDIDKNKILFKNVSALQSIAEINEHMISY
jgi:CRP/FNR family transcriptional regulator